MKDCDKVSSLYSVCLEGEASVADSGFFNEHLAACAHCRNDYATFSAMAGIVRKLPRVEPSPGFEDRVLALTRAAVAAPARHVPERLDVSFEPRWWEGWFPRLAMGGAVAALALFGTLAIQHRPAGILAQKSDATGVAPAPQEITTLQDLYPDLSPEKIESMRNITRDGVLDRVVIQPGSPNGNLRVVAPVDYGSDGPVYVTF
jgi:anti-sigma factor RsiW